MSFLHVFALFVIRCLATMGSFFAGVHSLIFRKAPTPLTQSRARIPQHLAVSLVSPSNTKNRQGENAVLEATMESALRVVRWSSQIRAQTLSLYDKHGVMKAQAAELESGLIKAGFQVTRTYKETKEKLDEENVEQRVISFDIMIANVSSVAGSSSDVQNGSDESTLPVSVDTIRLQLNLVSSADGMPAVARAAQTLARARAKPENSDANRLVTIEELDGILLEEVPAPQMMILYDLRAPRFLGQPPLELDGFPPWQLRLTELYDGASKWRFAHLFSRRVYWPIEEAAFCTVLDEFAAVEMREGR